MVATEKGEYTPTDGVVLGTLTTNDLPSRVVHFHTHTFAAHASVTTSIKSHELDVDLSLTN